MLNIVHKYIALSNLDYFFLIREPRDSYISVYLQSGQSFYIPESDLRWMLQRQFDSLFADKMLDDVYNFIYLRVVPSSMSSVRVEREEINQCLGHSLTR